MPLQHKRWHIMSEMPFLLDGYMPLSQAAAELGIHLRTLKRWRALRYGPTPVRVGKRLYYRRADLVSWLDGLGTVANRRGTK